MKKIEILDTTLREGAQSEQISFSAADKLHIAEALDAFGIPLIEGGNPASNPTDREFFAKCRLKNAALVAFTGTHRKELSPERDPGFAAVLEAGAPIVTVFGKCSREQAERVLGTEPEHNLEMIRASAAWFVQQGKRVIFDAEHFFDGYRSDSEYALAALRAAAEMPPPVTSGLSFFAIFPQRRVRRTHLSRARAPKRHPAQAAPAVGVAHPITAYPQAPPAQARTDAERAAPTAVRSPAGPAVWRSPVSAALRAGKGARHTGRAGVSARKTTLRNPRKPRQTAKTSFRSASPRRRAAKRRRHTAYAAARTRSRKPAPRRL